MYIRIKEEYIVRTYFPRITLEELFFQIGRFKKGMGVIRGGVIRRERRGSYFSEGSGATITILVCLSRHDPISEPRLICLYI